MVWIPVESRTQGFTHGRVDMKNCPTCGDDSLRLTTLVANQYLSGYDISNSYKILHKNLNHADSRVKCLYCYEIFPLRFLDDDYMAILQALKKELLRLCDGGSTKCWPLGSFAGTRADLVPEGCRGIRAFSGEHNDSIIIRVGGHRIFTRFSHSDDDTCENLVLDDSLGNELFRWGMDWDTYSVTVSFSDTIAIPRPMTEDRLYEKWAENIKSDALEALEEFSTDMKRVTALVKTWERIE